MMKILIVNTLYHPFKVGGAEVSVQLLAEGLVTAGNSVRVVCLYDQDIKKMEVINGVEVSYLPLFNKYWPFANYMPTKLEKLLWHFLDTYNVVMAKRVELEILDFKPDIVHTNNLAGFSVAVWDKVKKHNIKLVHTSRDYYLFHPNCTLFKNGRDQELSSIQVKLWSLIKRKMSKHVDYYVGISDFILNFHLNQGFFDEKKSTFIYNGVKKIQRKDFIRSKKVIGFIGRLTEDKGFDDFCNIAKQNSLMDLKFVAAGRFEKGANGVALKEKALESNIKLLGFVSLQDFLNEVDAVVLPVKWNEPFGRVVVECALAGINVYTNKKGGVSELFNFFDNIFEIDEIYLKLENNKLTNSNMNFSIENHVKLYTTAYEKALNNET